MEKTAGQIAYEAYCENRNWKSFDDKSLPQWHDVQPQIKAAWESGALAVLRSALTADQAEVLALLRDPVRLRDVCLQLQNAHSVATSLQRLAVGVPRPRIGG